VLKNRRLDIADFSRRTPMTWRTLSSSVVSCGPLQNLSADTAKFSS